MHHTTNQRVSDPDEDVARTLVSTVFSDPDPPLTQTEERQERIDPTHSHVATVSPERRVLVSGAGRMGRHIAEVIAHQKDDMELVGILTRDENSRNARAASHLFEDVPIITLARQISDLEPDIIVDFSHRHFTERLLSPHFADSSIGLVIGTSGFSAKDIKELRDSMQERPPEIRPRGIICPNFSIGAALMIRFAQYALFATTKYVTHIVEQHSVTKADKPSGTAQYLLEKLKHYDATLNSTDHIQSYRVPTTKTLHRVMFDHFDERLTIDHESYNLDTFVPGVLEVIRNIDQFSTLVYGTEPLLRVTTQSDLRDLDRMLHDVDLSPFSGTAL